MYWRALIWCFLATLAIGVQGAEAEFQADIKYVFYPVKPEPGRSLYDQLFKDTPLRHKGRAVTALADWNIKYERTYARIGQERCAIATYKVICTCTVTLPRLETDDARLASDFNAYLPLLKEHELTHCRIAADYARQMEERIKSLGQQKCDDLDKVLRAARSKAITEAKSAQRSLDQLTLARKRRINHAKIMLGDSYLSTGSPPTETPAQSLSSIADEAPPGQFYQDGDGVWKNY